MSSIGSVNTTEGEPDALQRPPRSMAKQVCRQTFAHWGARIGLSWILLLAVLAVFAPMLASSHPAAMKVDGKWSSPMLEHLAPSDVTLVVVLVLVLTLSFINKIGFAKKVLIFLVLLSATIVITISTVTPPKVVLYEKYREAEISGHVEAIWRAPIPYSPSDRLRDRNTIGITGPWWAGSKRDHWLGTEPNGSDMASRMIHASRIALAVGFISTGIAVLIGVVIGGVMGYFSGIVDLVGMRLVEIFEFIPQLFLLLMFAAFFPGDRPEILPGINVQRIYMIMAIIGFTSWAGYARFVRAEFLKLRQQDFVLAAKACGLPLRSILFKHILPNGLTPVVVNASFGVAGAILAEATLSFIGLGLVDEPSWGQLLNQAVTSSGAFTWWIAIFPGLAIFLTVFAYNLIGESLRDAIDPYTKKVAAT